MTDDSEFKLLLTLLADQSHELRYRAQAELVYTAAAIASFGATAWGVATLGSLKGTAGVVAIVFAILGVAALSGALWWRIWTDHTKYGEVKLARAGICERLESLAVPVNPKGIVPFALKDPVAGEGYRQSIWIVATAAVGTIAFCLAIIFSRPQC